MHEQIDNDYEVDHFCEDLDPSSAYFNCLVDPQNCSADVHHNCIWLKHQCPGVDGDQGVVYEDWEDWLACVEDEETVECGASGFDHYHCYIDGMDCADPNWHNCYWYNECGSDGTADQGFDHYLDCWENTDSYCYDEDPYGHYYDCYQYGLSCEDPNWYNCYWYDICSEDGEHNAIDTFDEWLKCYAAFKTCGENHS